jgi:hypothetical protein
LKADDTYRTFITVEEMKIAYSTSVFTPPLEAYKGGYIKVGVE